MERKHLEKLNKKELIDQLEEMERARVDDQALIIKMDEIIENMKLGYTQIYELMDGLFVEQGHVKRVKQPLEFVANHVKITHQIAYIYKSCPQ
ncbi:hypothetical protein [Microcystis phage MaeS]|nr:hypothetical protein [Microcystis phage MaeS]